MQTLSFLKFVGTWPVQVTTYLAITIPCAFPPSVTDPYASDFSFNGRPLNLTIRVSVTSVLDPQSSAHIRLLPVSARSNTGKKLFRALSRIPRPKGVSQRRSALSCSGKSIQLFRLNGPDAWNRIEGQGSVPTSLLRGAISCCKLFCQDWSGWFED